MVPIVLQHILQRYKAQPNIFADAYENMIQQLSDRLETQDSEIAELKEALKEAVDMADSERAARAEQQQTTQVVLREEESRNAVLAQHLQTSISGIRQRTTSQDHSVAMPGTVLGSLPLSNMPPRHVVYQQPPQRLPHHVQHKRYQPAGSGGGAYSPTQAASTSYAAHTYAERAAPTTGSGGYNPSAAPNMML